MTRRGFAVAVVAVLFLAVLLASIFAASFPSNGNYDDIHEVPAQAIGTSMFESYGVAFLIVGVALFVSMMGGVFLAQEEDDE